MADFTWSLDLSKLNKFTNQMAQMAGPEHREWLLSQVTPRVRDMMLQRLTVAYESEIEGGDEPRSKPTVTTGNYIASVRVTNSGGGRVIKLQATAPYSNYVEGDSFAATSERMAYAGRQATKAAFASQFGKARGSSNARRTAAVDRSLAKNGTGLSDLQQQLLRWCALKFPGNDRQMTAIINKVLIQGYHGRYLMASAFTDRTSGGTAFKQELHNFYRESYTDFMINFFQKAAS